MEYNTAFEANQAYEFMASGIPQVKNAIEFQYMIGNDLILGSLGHIGLKESENYE